METMGKLWCHRATETTKNVGNIILFRFQHIVKLFCWALLSQQMLSMFLDDMRKETLHKSGRTGGGGLDSVQERLCQGWVLRSGVAFSHPVPTWLDHDRDTYRRPPNVGDFPHGNPIKVLNIIITYATLYVSGTRLCVDFMDLTMWTCSALLLGLRRVCQEMGIDRLCPVLMDSPQAPQAPWGVGVGTLLWVASLRGGGGIT